MPKTIPVRAPFRSLQQVEPAVALHFI